MTARLNFTFAVLVGAMLDVSKRVEVHKTLSPDQAQLLTVGKSVSEKTHEIFSELCVRIMNDPAMAFVSMFMKKSGVVDNESYRRVAVVSFPVYEELCKEQDKYFGMTLKPAERDNLKAIMEYVLPNIGVAAKYNKGSNSDVAPYMDALMLAFGNIAGHFNDKIELFQKYIAEHEILAINSDWVEVFENLEAYRTQIKLVPQQAGNEGAGQVQGVQPTMQPMPQPPQVVQPAQQPQPQAYISAPQFATPQQQVSHQQPVQDKPKSFSDMIASAPHLQQYRNTTVYPAGVMPAVQSPSAPRSNWQQPQQMYQQPMMGQPMYGQPMQPGMYPQQMYGQPMMGQPMYPGDMGNYPGRVIV